MSASMQTKPLDLSGELRIGGPKGSYACLSIFIQADNPLKFELFTLSRIFLYNRGELPLKDGGKLIKKKNGEFSRQNCSSYLSWK